MLFIKYISYIFIFSGMLTFILAFVQMKKQKLKIKENEALFFEKIKKNKPILKISENVYYYQGGYLTYEYFIFNQCKIRHYKDVNFINQLLKTV